MIKKWHLFLFVIILFAGSFYVINLKYDEFYRVNGINNDNRVLIEKYLSKDEQKYLVENQIPIKNFIKYIKSDDFSLENYQYYNLLSDTGRYTKSKTILLVGNALASSLEKLYDEKAYGYAKTLVNNALEHGYLNDKSFDFDNLDYYIAMKPLYKNDDYIKDTASYIQKLNGRNMSDETILKKFFTAACQDYTESSLKDLMKKADDNSIHLIDNPSSLTTILNDHSYVASYEPKNLVLIQDVHRAKYLMYLRSDAYKALLKMHQAMDKALRAKLVIKNAYSSYNEIKSLAGTKVAGFNEYQLGLTVDITQLDVAYKDFDKSDVSAWLIDNAYKYGFVLRYPQHKASLTGHAYDAHCYRYVGTSVATTLHANGSCLDEYMIKK